MVVNRQIETLEQEKFVLDDNGNVAVRTTAVLETGDIEIGAVEIKDGATDNRVMVDDPADIDTDSNAMSTYDANVDAALTDVNSELDSHTTLITSTNTKLDTSNTALSDINSELDSQTTLITSGNSTLTDIETNTEVGNDSDLNVKMVMEQSPLWSRYTTPVEIVSEQDLTSSYADYGYLLNTQGYTHIGFIIAGDVNDSEDCDVQVVGEMTATGTDEIEFETGGTKTLWTGTGTDFIKYYEFDVSAMPFVQLQAKVGTVGSTAGDLTVSVVKIWRP